jgi:hypothetical protein
MRLRLRLLLRLLASFFRRRLSLIDEKVLDLRVLPNAVDVTRFGPVFSANSYAIAGYCSPASSPLVPSSVDRVPEVPVTLAPDLLGCECVWTEHRFERGGRTTAIGITKVAFRGRQGIVPLAVAGTYRSAAAGRGAGALQQS